MNKQREQLIAALAADLKPIRGAGRITTTTLSWLVAALLFSLAVLLLDGPMRADSTAQLLRSPRFLLETVVAGAAIIALGLVGMKLTVPAMRAPLEAAIPALALLALWIGLLAYGLHAPALEPSMSGKRELCWFDTAVIGLPALAIGLYLARRRWPLHGGWTGLLLGLAAGAIPALLMQFACMYIPLHGLLFHLLPGLALGPLGALVGALLLRPR